MYKGETGPLPEFRCQLCIGARVPCLIQLIADMAIVLGSTCMLMLQVCRQLGHSKRVGAECCLLRHGGSPSQREGG